MFKQDSTKSSLCSPRIRRLIPAFTLVCLLTVTLLAQAQHESVIYNFTGGIDGAHPFSVIRDSSTGVIYGTTIDGGCGGEGVVFKASPGGESTVIHCFADLWDGGVPLAGLVRDSAGALYGTASEGGSYDYYCPSYGCGVVFKVNPDPPFDYTILHTFYGANDGLVPNAIMIDKAGNLFGTTFAGGAFGWGVVFKIDTARKFTVLYSFTGGADGGGPVQGLAEDAAGNLYGLTEFAGAYNAGVIFKVSGTTETVIHNFTGGSDGGYTRGSDGHPILDSAGNLYGTTVAGGNLSACGGSGCGVVFRLSPGGVYTVLHSFTGGSDGTQPNASLLRTSAGVIYGTSANVAYRLSPSGSLTVLHTFTGGSGDGIYPNGGLTMDSAGTLYGSAGSGGTGCCNGAGVIFKILR
jgi:uncharacterized repeat protein (TIGR03803 family)